jgi:hypothetical protein
LQDHAICALDLPIRAGVRHGGPVDAHVVVITEPEEFLSRELRAIIRDDGVWDSKVVNDVKKKLHGLLEFDLGDRPSFYPLCELVHGDK